MYGEKRLFDYTFDYTFIERYIMAGCDELIKAGIGVNCDVPFVPGIEANGIIINRQDIDFAATVFDTERKNIIKTLVLKAGKQGYEVYNPGKTPFTGSNTAMEEGTYVNTFAKTLSMVVLDHGPEVCADVIDGLANGEFVHILRNKFKGTNGKAEYEIFGYYQGLHAATMTKDSYAEETNGGWAITLTETKAPKSGMFYFNTDSATTAQQFETLKQPAA